jgi:pimeloyl-ACP methyl ester carboxylesterase
MKFLVQQQPAHVFTGSAAGDSEFDPAKPSVVFIHGAANDHGVWAPVLQQSAEKRYFPESNLLAVDLPGHGQTFAEAKTSIEAYADWLINFLDNGAIKAATLVGHSMGSLIALDVARRYPDRVARLGLIGTALPMPVSDAVTQMVQTDPAAACDQLTRWNFYLRKNADGSFPPPSPAMQVYRSLLAAARPGVMATDLAACARYQLDDATIAAITTPTFILASENDKMTSAAAATSLSTRLPNAKLTMLSGVGHSMMQETPTKVAEWINTLIDPAAQETA